MGLMLGDPGITLEPAVIGAPVIGISVVACEPIAGAKEGRLPGVIVRVSVAREFMVGVTVIGLMLRDPRIIVTAAVMEVLRWLESDDSCVIPSPQRAMYGEWIRLARLPTLTFI